MSIINRITTTFTASVDKVVSKLENHEAVIEASIKDCRTLAAKARVRNVRVMKDGEALRGKLSGLKAMEITWTDRARAIAEDNEQKALDCLHRRNRCRDQIGKTADELVQHERVKQQVGLTLEKIERRLSEITLQRNSMRSRHSAADAMRVLSNVDNSVNSSFDDTFERWEMVIREAEYQIVEDMSIDTLDKEFSDQEHSEALRAELALLLESSSDSDEDGDEQAATQKLEKHLVENLLVDKNGDLS